MDFPIYNSSTFCVSIIEKISGNCYNVHKSNEQCQSVKIQIALLAECDLYFSGVTAKCQDRRFL